MRRTTLRLHAIGVLLLAVAFQAQGRPGANYKTLDEAVMAQVQQWQQTNTIKPIVSDEGRVLYPFGQYMPTLTCGIMRACSVDLQPGEILMDSTRGDTMLWKMDRARSKDPRTGALWTHVIFKPTLPDIETNVILFTDRRVYHIKLVSTKSDKEYMNQIGFYYPDEIVQTWENEAQADQAAQDEASRKADLPTVSLDEMDWGYTIRGGDKDQRPVRVGNDGRRVWIQMSPMMDRTEVPTLVLLDDDGKPQDVNSRRIGRDGEFFLVDRLFKRAQLLYGGSDGSVSKITIIWDKHKRWSW
ncbi:TrbG/VirB9 family P-type conjugative transfer protein (plasmid) [Achromobacter sp. CF-sbj1-Ac2-l]|uniref:TrbG/VirB9 family P-type conjugative transfer protein n=1 Tax=Achromobacter TaxID=222 RepID=UPI0006C8AD89|nr:TrbG/VirB9 family P-type conjugative transfer protein [Achromobacter xylosoxidans]